MSDADARAAATFCSTLVDEWVRAGITEAVVSPGSRSTPLVLAVARDGRLRVHVHPDERSAGFVALGAAAASGRPTVVVTTSGTAAVELHPAVVEAHESGVALIVCTADRPPELQGVGAPQTIDQVRLFGTSVRAVIEPGVPSAQSAASWRALASRCVLAATGPNPGPVHVLLPFRDPLVSGPDDLPPGRADGAPWRERIGRERRPGFAELGQLAARLHGRRGVVIAGGGVEEPEPVLQLAAQLGWPVLADPRSGCRLPSAGVVAHADPVLRVLGGALVPEVVLRLGAPPASRVVSAWLSSHRPSIVSVDARGTWHDAEHLVAVAVEGEPGQVCAGLLAATSSPAPAGPAAQGWSDAWTAAEAAVAATLERELDEPGPLSEPGIARAVSRAVPDAGLLVVSSSMPVRDLEWFSPARGGLRVLANRGANGIDGVVSTAVGAALSTGAPTVALVGDLAFLHDTNALLGAEGRPIRLTIVVVDNDGGGIFSFLPQASALDHATFESLFGTPHGLRLEDVAASHGARASRAEDAGELAERLRAIGAEGVEVIVAQTDRASNVARHGGLDAAVAEALRSIDMGSGLH